ncbi:unnamed protein product [Heligmosomoides polygyrus]|uniref:MRG domain-containing protein n=1 Tax=Heligmosomoides polygyrus TaxID=6339 RepID=A0A183FUG6_HELPZ|nr:unnamed protein product [Heligmosomoides polygyrus]
MAPKKDQRYEVNYKVLCKHGAFFYEAKITDVEEEHGEMVYTVHYQGWHKRYDERIRQSQCPEMFLPLTEANIAKAKADILEASAAKTKKSENDSRASTPSDRAGITGIFGSILVGCGSRSVAVPSHFLTTLSLNLPDYTTLRNYSLYDLSHFRYTLQTLPLLNLECLITIHEGGTTRIPGVDSLCTCAKNLRDYFDVVLSYQLLYKSEKPQYQALAKREQEKFDDGGPLRPEMIRPSKFYGLAHLLRLLVKLPVLLRLNLTNDLEFMVRIACYHDFIAFLRQNAPFILDFDLDYKVSGSA